MAFRTKHAGNSAIALRNDGKVCAIGGWDGKFVEYSETSFHLLTSSSHIRARLYSTKSFKALGALKYHKSAIHALEFAHDIVGDGQEAGEHTGRPTGAEFQDDDELSSEEKLERSRWLLTGSKDNRVAIWPLITFSK